MLIFKYRFCFFRFGKVHLTKLGVILVGEILQQQTKSNQNFMLGGEAT